jgi:predicted acetyltransferase
MTCAHGVTRITRVVAENEITEFLRVNRDSFAFRSDADSLTGVEGDDERRFGVFDDGSVVGVGRNYSMELTLPGGPVVPVGGVSWISVDPLHRRRGVMSALIAALVADSASRGEVASVLTASEGSIYWRQGYGPATWGLVGDVDLTRRPTMFGAPASGSLRLVPFVADALLDVLVPVFAKARSQPGMVSRPSYWWRPHLGDMTQGPDYKACVVHTGVDGVDDGYVLYKVSGSWNRDGVPEKVLEVMEFITASPDAHRALWQHLIERDLVANVRVARLPIDDPIRMMLTDTRAFATRGVMDRLWIRPIDTYALLAARSYSPGEPVVIDVNGQCFRVGHDGVSQSVAPADLVMDGASLGAVVLGGTDVSALVVSGRIVEHRAGAAADADRLLQCTPKPAMLTGF